MWWHDVVLAIRRMRAAPAFTVFAAASIAIGVGLTTAISSFVFSVCWRPVGIPESERVAVVSSRNQDSAATLTADEYAAVGAQQTVFESMAASAISHAAVTYGAVRADVELEEVSPDYFSVLRVRPVLGRTLDSREEHDAAAVVSHRFWRRAEAAGIPLLGQTLTVNGTKFVVVGVAPSSFEGLNPTGVATSAWVPHGTAQIERQRTDPMRRGTSRFIVVGRLKEPSSHGAAARELGFIADRLDRDEPTTGIRREKRRWSTLPIDRWPGTLRWPPQVGVVLLILGFLVLVVACSNVANLLLSRGEQRRGEFAVRLAVGARRGVLIRQQLVEVGLIGVIGAAGALVVLRLLLSSISVDLPVAQGRVLHVEPVIDMSVFALAGGAVLLSIAIAGVWPALDLTRPRSSRTLSATASAAIGSLRAQWLVLRWQLAVSTGLFLIVSVCASLVVAEARHDSGIRLNEIAVSNVTFPSQWDAGRLRYETDSILEELRAMPGIDAAAATIGLPFGLPGTPLVLAAPAERPRALDGGAPQALLVTGTENVLGALGVTIVRGRGFGPTDRSASTNAVVISERAALSVFGSADILGRQISIKRVTADGVSKPETSVVIGVAGDTDVGRLFERDTGVVYAPLRLDSSRTRLSFVARGHDDPQVTAQRLQAAMRRNAPSLISTDAAPARTVLAGLFVLLRYTALLAGIFGVATLALSAIGLYGLLSQIVAARTREVGVRLALGATPFHVLTLVLRDGLRTVLVGLAIGVGIGAAVRTLIRFTLNQAVAIVDFYSVAAIGILLLLAGALACYLPGRRAARLEPSVALREL